jgi:hypothetical protein
LDYCLRVYQQDSVNKEEARQTAFYEKLIPHYNRLKSSLAFYLNKIKTNSNQRLFSEIDYAYQLAILMHDYALTHQNPAHMRSALNDYGIASEGFKSQKDEQRLAEISSFIETLEKAFAKQNKIAEDSQDDTLIYQQLNKIIPRFANLVSEQIIDELGSYKTVLATDSPFSIQEQKERIAQIKDFVLQYHALTICYHEYLILTEDQQSDAIENQQAISHSMQRVNKNLLTYLNYCDLTCELEDETFYEQIRPFYSCLLFRLGNKLYGIQTMFRAIDYPYHLALVIHTYALIHRSPENLYLAKHFYERAHEEYKSQDNKSQLIPVYLCIQAIDRVLSDLDNKGLASQMGLFSKGTGQPNPVIYNKSEEGKPSLTYNSLNPGASSR